MKPKNKTLQHLGFTKFITLSLGLSVGGLSTHSSQADTIYWDTAADGNWSDVTKWSTDSTATTHDPGSVPAIGDDVFFNRTAINGAEIISLNGNQAAKTLTFNNTNTTTIRSSLANQTLTLASGITVNTGAGLVTIGSSTIADNRTNVILGTAGADQAWTLNGTTSMTVINGVAGSATLGNTQTLTINGSSSGIVTFSGNTTAITDGANGGKLALLVNGTATNTPGSVDANLAITLSSANSYTGGTTVTQGRINANNVLCFGAANSLVTVQGTTDGGIGGQAWLANTASAWLYDFNISGFGNNEGTGNGQKYALRMNSNVTIGASTNTFTVANAAAIGINGNGSFTIASKITGTGALTIRSGGNSGTVNATFTNADNDYSGTTTLTRATLQLNASTAAQNSIINTGAGSNVLKFGNGITAATIGGLAGTGGGLALLNNLSGAVALTVGNNNNTGMSYSGVISGTGSSLIKTGAGTQTLTGLNTYTGATTVNRGTLTLSSSGTNTAVLSSSSALALGGGTLNVNNGTTGGGTNMAQTVASLSLNSGASSIALAQGVGTNKSVALTLGAISSRTAGSTVNFVQPAGTLVLGSNGISTTTGNVNGILSLAGTGAWATFGTGTSMQYAVGSADGTTATLITGLTGDAAGTGAAVTSTAGTFNYDVATSSTSGTDTMGASASVNTLRYLGNGGTLTVATDFTTNGIMNVGNGALTISGTTTIGANKELVFTGGGNITMGVVQNNGGNASSLTMSGTGTLALSNTNTYTGATKVNAGTLLVSGSIGNSAVTVANNGTLASGTTGTIGNSVSVSSGGTLAAGGVGAIGTATVGSGGLALSSGSIFAWDLSGATGSLPTADQGSYDKVVSNGTLSGTSIFNVVLGTSDFTDTFWNSTHTWSDIFTGAGVPSNLTAIFTTFSGTSVNTDGSVTGQGGFSFNGSTTLTWSAVPEPTSALAGLLLTAGLLRRRRKN